MEDLEAVQAQLDILKDVAEDIEGDVLSDKAFEAVYELERLLFGRENL